MANTKLPARLLDTSAIPALNVTGDLTVDTTTLKVDSTNNRVGIGTSAANRKLEIAGNNNGGAKANYIRITDTDTSATLDNQQGGIEFYTNDNDPGIAASMEVLYAGSGGGGEITFNTAAHSTAGVLEAMRIDASGNVGIGTTSPSTPLHVTHVGNPNGGNRNTVEDVLTLEATGYYPYAGYGMGINFQGEDYGNSAIRDYGKIQAVMSTSSDQNAAGDPAFSSHLGFWTNTGGASATVSTEKMRLSNAGNLGIGVTNPGQTLEIHNSDASDYTDFALRGTGHKYVIGVGNDSVATVNDKWYLYDNDNTAFRMVVDTSGNVGIGTDSPSRKLDVRGAVRFSVNTSTHETFVFTTQAANDAKQIMKNASSVDTIVLNTGGNSWLNGGNVGIGTTNPTNKFSINRTSINTNERMINLYTGTTGPGKYVSIGAQYAENNALSNSEIRFGNEVQSSSPSFLAFATGNTSTPTEHMRIATGGDMIYGGSTGVHEKYFSGFGTGNGTFSHDITHTADNSTGTVLEIKAAFTHHPSYDCILHTWISRRDSTVSHSELFRRDTTLSGSWTVSRVSTTVTRVTKNAGTYAGGGPYWIKAIWRNY